jgi:hypothetical protein
MWATLGPEKRHRSEPSQRATPNLSPTPLTGCALSAPQAAKANGHYPGSTSSSQQKTAQILAEARDNGKPVNSS